MLSEPAGLVFKLHSCLCFALVWQCPLAALCPGAAYLCCDECSSDLGAESRGTVVLKEQLLPNNQRVWIVSFHSRHEQDVLIHCLGMLSCPCWLLEYSIKSLQIISSQNLLKTLYICELQSWVSLPSQRIVHKVNTYFYQKEQYFALQRISKQGSVSGIKVPCRPYWAL